MGKKMLCLANRTKGYVAFFDIGDEEEAKRQRRIDPRLKNARLEECFQMRPSKIKKGRVYPTWEISQW